MTFKDVYAADIEDVFFDLDEFAEEHKWNKSTITCVIDDEDLINKFSGEFQFLPKGSHCVYVPVETFDTPPKTSEVVKFDGGFYTIDEIKEQSGVYIIFLARGKQSRNELYTND